MRDTAVGQMEADHVGTETNVDRQRTKRLHQIENALLGATWKRNDDLIDHTASRRVDEIVDATKDRITGDGRGAIGITPEIGVHADDALGLAWRAGHVLDQPLSVRTGADNGNITRETSFMPPSSYLMTQQHAGCEQRRQTQ